MEVVIFSGLQGAGKSSFYRARFATTHVLVSKDLFRNNRRPSRRQAYLLETALAAGHSVVVDNTNPTRLDRTAIIDIARAYGAEIAGYFFDVKVADCLECNRGRQGKARVPDRAIFATAKRLVRPSYEEGFDRLFRVSLSPDGQFVVEKWSGRPRMTDRSREQ